MKKKLFRLYAYTGGNPILLAEGSEDYCETKRLDLSMEGKYNTSELKVCEVEEGTTKNEEEISLKDYIILGASKFINWLFKKE